MAANRSPRGSRQKSLIFGHDREIIEWMRRHEDFGDMGPARAIGVAVNGQIEAAVAFFNYRWPDIEIAIVARSARWADRGIFRALANYVFDQLKCNRVTAIVDPGNRPVCKLLEGSGFVVEGVKRHALPNGDARIYGVLKAECKWHEIT